MWREADLVREASAELRSNSSDLAEQVQVSRAKRMAAAEQAPATAGKQRVAAKQRARTPVAEMILGVTRRRQHLERLIKQRNRFAAVQRVGDIFKLRGAVNGQAGRDEFGEAAHMVMVMMGNQNRR